MRKTFGIGLASALLLAMLVIVPIQAQAAQGWVTENGNTYYYEDDDYFYYDGIYEIDGAEYYFDEDGVLRTGWIDETYDYGDGDSYTEWYYADPETGSLAKGWTIIDGKKYYFNDTMLCDGIVEINGDYYYFDTDGVLLTEWIEDNWEDEEGNSYTSWYYADPETGILADGWKTIDGKKYYFGWSMNNGGRCEIDGAEYYFDENGVLQTGWISETYEYDDGDTDTNWYYADANGVLQSGWQEIGGKKYYFDPEGYFMYDYITEIDGENYYFDANGVLKTGWISETYEYDDGDSYTEWYYADTNGALYEGWQKVGGKWYYFEPDGYYMYDEGIWKINGKYYYFNEDGVLQTKWFRDEYGDWYYADANGVLQKGWQKIDGKWYYLDPDYYFMYSGIHKISGKYYYLAENGVMQTSWIKETETYDGVTYTEWYYANTGGDLAVGWKKISNKWYYFDPDWPVMVTGGRVIDGVLYSFNKNGVLTETVKTTGWKKIDGVWFYVDSNKKAVVNNWKKLSGKWYFFDGEGVMLSTGHYYIKGKYYFFNADGSLVSKAGWQKETHTYGKKTYTDWFYVNSNGTCVTDTWKKISGNWYHFEEDGYMTANEWAKDSGGWMYMDANGKITKNKWVKYDDDWYYLKSNGYMATGTLTISGKTYTFDSSGRWIS